MNNNVDYNLLNDNKTDCLDIVGPEYVKVNNKNNIKITSRET